MTISPCEMFLIFDYEIFHMLWDSKPQVCEHWHDWFERQKQLHDEEDIDFFLNHEIWRVFVHFDEQLEMSPFHKLHMLTEIGILPLSQWTEYEIMFFGLTESINEVSQSVLMLLLILKVHIHSESEHTKIQHEQHSHNDGWTECFDQSRYSIEFSQMLKFNTYQKHFSETYQCQNEKQLSISLFLYKIILWKTNSKT